MLTMPTDTELIARLDEVAGFRPCDNWAHVIQQLRAGKTHAVIDLYGGLKQIGIVEELANYEND
jgi:hypothetical protein